MKKQLGNILLPPSITYDEAVAKQEHTRSLQSSLTLQTCSVPWAMAFPIPSHLPRRPNPHDVSSNILSKIDEATTHTLNASLASSWVTELDESIQVIKVGNTMQVALFSVHVSYRYRNVYTTVYTPTSRTSIASWRHPSLCRHGCSPCPQTLIN